MTTSTIHGVSAPFTLSSQPSFSGNIGTIDSNITGDGTIFTLGSAQAFTEVYDQGGDFNTNGTFTAPVTGKYHFNVILHISGLSGSHTLLETKLVTSNRSYVLIDVNPENIKDSNGNFIMNASMLADMDASDTATITIDVRNSTLTIDLQTQTYFSGFLAN